MSGTTRPPRRRTPRSRDETASVAGTELVLDVGPPAHGGHAVARHDGRVVFVRHAVEGEQVRARVTQGRPKDSFWFADAVEVLTPSPDRVTAPCPVSGPGGCGGCDLQHVSLPGQRRWKAAVIRDLLVRVGKVHLDDLPAVMVEPLPGPGTDDGLGWRTRLRLAVAPNGTVGMRGHRGNRVVALETCAVASPEVLATGVLDVGWPGVDEIAIAAGTSGVVVTASRSATDPASPSPSTTGPDATAGPAAVPPPGWTRPDGVGVVVVEPDGRSVQRGGRAWVSHDVSGVDGSFRVGGSGFWQAHPSAAAVYVAAVRDALQVQPGHVVLDLYSGSGLFAAALADVVGPDGRVVAVEGDAGAVTDARRNLHRRPQVEIVDSDVAAALAATAAAIAADVLPPVDAVVLDPPRAGAGHDVVDAIADLRPRLVAYVACDPASLARDIARFAGHGYTLATLRAFDAFPMTHHVECVATLRLTHPQPPREPPGAVGQDVGGGAATGVEQVTSEGDDT